MSSSPGPRNLVTVVVPTRNSARTLAACLTSIRRQTHPHVELIVVDNDSSDGTVELARAQADTVLFAGPERSAQRNAGADAATSAWLFFVDSDMVMGPGVIAECLEAARNAQAVVVPETSFGEGFWSRCKALERTAYVGDDTIEAARFIARQTFVACGGYDTQMNAGEDWDLHARMKAHGARISRIAAFIHHDEGQLRLRNLVAKKFRYGRELRHYVRRHPELARTQVLPVRAAFLRHRKQLLAQPALLCGIVAMKLCEFGAGGAGFLSARISQDRS